MGAGNDQRKTSGALREIIKLTPAGAGFFIVVRNFIILIFVQMFKMKYWLLACTICICSCTCNQQLPPTAVNEERIIEKDSAKKSTFLQEYAAYLQNLDTSKLNNSSLAVEKYKLFFNNVDTADADSAYVLFFAFYNVMLDKLLDQHYKNYTDQSAFTISSTGNVTPKTQQAKQYLSQLHLNGFTLSVEEGSTYVKQDVDFIAKHFYNTVSTTMRIYLEQVQRENKEGFLSDAAMVITPTALATRIIFWDDFLMNHSSFVFNETIREKQREYLTFLLEGVDNTPLLDHTTKQLSARYEKAYQYVLVKHPNSNLAEILKPYYQNLQKNSIARDQQILKQYRSEKKILDFEQ